MVFVRMEGPQQPRFAGLLELQGGHGKYLSRSVLICPPLVQAVPVLVALLGPVGSNVGAAVADEAAVAKDLVELLPLLQVQLLLRCPSHLHSPANRNTMR